MIGLLFRIPLLLLRMVMLPLKILRTAITLVTCVVPVLIGLAIVAAIVWFLFIR